MTVNAITDTKKGRTGIAPTYLHTTQFLSTQTIIGMLIFENFFLESKIRIPGNSIESRWVSRLCPQDSNKNYGGRCM